MTTALLLSFGVVFVAELGDKSQLMALSFALRHRWQVVLAGISAAAVSMFAIAAAAGHLIGAALPTTALTAISGLAFLAVGCWSLRPEPATDNAAAHTALSAFLTVGSTFFLAELGDKTMFATITLAAEHNGIGVWLGSTAAMLAADGLALAVGIAAGKRLPAQQIRLAGAFGFLFVGSWTLLGLLRPDWSTAALLPAAAVLPAVVAVATLQRHRDEALAKASP